ncbi:formylglycine-generating enzyme family protein [Pendulispora brunnea]|uniref:Formylglycine-generating enzyme family protein n=1 Tax=Pendulispora brunnea TaxID=2905690 RepID=A0ABZ2K8J6_9BACT
MRRAAVLAAMILFASCRRTPAPQGAPPEVAHDAVAETPMDAAADAPKDMNDAGAPSDAEDASVGASDPMLLHRETQDELLALFDIRNLTPAEKRHIQPDRFLRSEIGTDGPSRMNQGNKAIASHLISREQCLEGLRGVTVQTAEQREMCGAENMVPIWKKGKAPWFCIDVFEFPNKACELPFVWAPPTSAKKVCELQGKRLCSDIEWNMACRGDPEGGEDWRYAYGSKLDLEVCNTDKGHIRTCIVRDSKTAWATCATETEPSGSYPRCRSRFGVFDQHGNVAEIMMRRRGDEVVTQLKGSAWYYNELAKEPGEPTPASTPNKQGAYPDHCNFDPRWHVEPIDSAYHVNYHLGFRCCKSVTPSKSAKERHGG